MKKLLSPNREKAWDLWDFLLMFSRHHDIKDPLYTLDSTMTFTSKSCSKMSSLSKYIWNGLNQLLDSVCVTKSSHRDYVLATKYIVITAVVGTYRSLFLPHIRTSIHLLSVSRVLQYYVSALLWYGLSQY